MLRFFIALAFFTPLAFSAQVSIGLRAQAEVEAGVVRLGQIADIKGDAELSKKISQIEVGRVAEPGRKTRVTERAVKDFFIKSVATTSQVNFNGAKFCDVIARAGLLSADSLKVLILKEVRTKMPANLQEGKDWIFEAPKAKGNIATPENGGSVLITLSPQFSARGQEMATVQILDNSRIISKHTVPFIIRRFENVAELRGTIRKGEVVSAENVDMVWQETTFQKRKILTNANDAIGRSSIRTIKDGELLTDNSLMTRYAVNEGKPVKLFAKIGSAVVQTNAIAQKNAYKGQTILVRNIDSGREISATVSDTGEAWVN
ncbi:hypothetical protein AGMMS49938_10600 [Fibrobacterales bacterium]|nr:hypothetical protein AGMMS49938_10600 [Fibrobacterales bacterium]